MKMTRMQPVRSPNRRRLGVYLSILGGMGIAFCCGRYMAPSSALALPPILGGSKKPETPLPMTPMTPTGTAGDYAHRPVAYIYGTQMITREDLGEYLIARDGTAKLQYLVNHRIIEQACKEKKIQVTSHEVDAALAADLAELKLDIKQFTERLLKVYRKSLFEWREDVIWPKLALSKLARGRVSVTDKDLHDAFEAFHGERVDCRMIVFPKEEVENVKNKIYAELRNPERFEYYARHQYIPRLAATGGKPDNPIAHHTTGSESMERELFALNPDEISTINDTPEGCIVFKCIQRIPKDPNVTIEKVRPALEKIILEKKMQNELGKVFQELTFEAKPNIFLKHDETEEELQRKTIELLQAGAREEAAGKTKRD